MTNWDNQEKTGRGNGGWKFNEPNLTFNQMFDPDTGNIVYFNGLGLTVTWTNIAKTVSILLALSISI